MFNTGDLSVADEIVAPSYVNHNAVPGETPGREGLKAFVSLLRTAFSAFHITVEDQIAEGDKVVTRFSVRGSHQAEFAGVPAINVHRVTDGLFQEAWLNWDALGMMQQLGAIPAPGEGGEV